MIGRTLLRRPGQTLLILGSLALVGAIAFNALVLQVERHPAPLMTTPAAVATPTIPAKVPLPPARNTEQAEKLQREALVTELRSELEKRGFFVAAGSGQVGTTLEAAIRDYQETAGLRIDGQPSESLLAHVKASKLKIKDQILQMLKPGQAAADNSKTVLMVQKALNKLGYGPLKEDGAMGAGTKNAIEHFERDRKLAVKGEPQGKLLRELGAAAGMAIE